MLTNRFILIAILALSSWGNVVFASYICEDFSEDSAEDSAEDAENEILEAPDEDLFDEGAPSHVHTHHQCPCMGRYLVTATYKKSFDRLFKKLDKLEECRQCTEVKRVLSNAFFVASIRTSYRCAEKLARKGYMVEEHFMAQIAQDVLPSLPVHLQDRIDMTNLPLDHAAYDRNEATDVNIFMLDTGVLTTHDEFNNNGVARALFYNDTVTPDNPNQLDVNGHGTRCASVAIGANIGVARGATIQSIRVANPLGMGDIDDIIAGLDDVQRWWNQNQGSKCVVSYSMLSQAISTTLNNAFINLAEGTDCVIVVAGGNLGQETNTADACFYSPAVLEEVITVGSSRLRNQGFTDDRAGFSNYGPCVDIYAPGRNINLAAPAGTINSNYVISSGTSFSTPAVAGAAAMILSTTTLTPTSSKTMTDLVRDILIRTSVKNKLTNLPSETAAELPSFNRLLNVEDNTYYQ